MKSKFSLLTLALVSTLSLTACGNDSGSTEEATASTVTADSTDEQKVGYTIGYAWGENYKSQFTNIDLDTFTQGLRDSYADKDSVLTEEQMEAVMEAYGNKRQEEMKKEYDDMLANNKAEGEKYLTENGAKEGVTTTESGLQYKVIEAGDGDNPTLTDIVSVHYEGKLLNGDVFDSSYERNQPNDFLLGQMIEGWKEGIPLMKKGAKYEFTIPSNLAYGENGTQGIEPNSVLIFTVELLDIKEAPAQ